jgi:hypothetical protein
VLVIKNTADLQRQYLGNGYAVIPNFLPAEVAERVHRFLAGSMPEDWWFAAIRQPYTSRQLFNKAPANLALIEAHARVARAAFASGQFCYFFFRTLSDHPSACPCEVCMARRLLAATGTRHALSTVTGCPLHETNESFASRYDGGCFLGVHTDAGQGRVAFTWNLTKDWHPQWGGDLHVLENGSLRTKMVISPKFNTLVLLNVAEPAGKPHFVSHVAPGVTSRRLAVSGWYS